ncbi:MAG: galactokinase [Cyclobacteriaceae bacterium]
MHLSERFREKFGNEPVIIRSPGRINLIGEHTDYNDGFVLPCAVQYHLEIAMALNTSERCRCFSDGYGDADFSINDLRPGRAWINYVMGVIDGFRKRGNEISGFDLYIEGNLPVGAGISSSAALCSGVAYGLSELHSFEMKRIDLALIARHSEHHFAGVRCGIMDQYACLFGEKDNALLLDCRSVSHENVPLRMDNHCWLLINSGVHHSLANSAYNDRRASCEEGVLQISKKYEVSSLRDVTEEMLKTFESHLSSETFMRCRYVVEEIDRTRRAAENLKAGNLRSFGTCMFETHRGLSVEYEASCEEIDFLVDVAFTTEGVLGARMMGGGFGGCTLNLVDNNSVKQFSDDVVKKYVARFKKEPDFYQVTVEDGVQLIH